MCDFNNLSEADKLNYHNEITKYVEAFGGQNFFLQLLEAIRSQKPHPLLAKHSKFESALGTVTWNKVLFKDKLDLLLAQRTLEGEQGDFLPPKESKNYKKVLNLVRTLGPITFTVMPKEGEGFTLKAFEMDTEKSTRLNPIFDALFFCAVETVKKAINYKSKA